MTEEINSSFGKKRRVRIDSHQQLENEPDVAPSAPSQSKAYYLNSIEKL
jgi:hypothetical protein